MIYRLRRKFILICALSFLLVFSCMFVILTVTSHVQKNNFMDNLTDTIADNGGTFPKPEQNNAQNNTMSQPPDFSPGMDAETPFSTRFFTVRLNDQDEITQVNTKAVSSISEETAKSYAEKAVKKNKKRGWISDYRYKIYNNNGTTEIVFVNGNVPKAMSSSNLFMISVVFAISGAVVLILIILFSEKAVKPAAESYEKQKQFITDVNHELKTPLTLILANIDIAESELGQNEWLDDIRSEGQRMSGLVNRLVTLSRMDESDKPTETAVFSLSDAAEDTAAEFQRLAEESGKKLTSDIAEANQFCGNEPEIRQLIAILLDNAVKYCDPDGDISVTLTAKKHPVLRVENTYRDVHKINISRLFDRFYREDPARTPSNSFGIGLSLAVSLAERNHAELNAFPIGNDRICFQVKFMPSRHGQST